MTFTERLHQLRRQRGLSQEDLAGELGVTRQAVQKWESGASRPDMDNLVALSRYFNVTLDYLITGESSISAEPSPPPATIINNHYHNSRWEYEYKSTRTLWGLPLVHIHIKDNGLVCAKGIIAIGNVSVGLISAGIISTGLLSIGTLSLGLISIGCLALGLASIGCMAAGLIAVGAMAVGWLSIGGLVWGVYGIGGVVEAAQIGMGGVVKAPLAIGRVPEGSTAIQLPEGDLPPETLRAIREAISASLAGRHPWLEALFTRLL